MVMMGHLLVESIDGQLPCSLSPAAHDIVRKEMKFNKIIISDDMQMKAITNKYSIGEAAVMALNAGTDILEYRDMEKAKEALEAINQALKLKNIKNEVMRPKLKRINDCKKEYLKEYRPTFIPNVAQKINTRASQIFLEDLKKKLESAQNRPL